MSRPRRSIAALHRWPQHWASLVTSPGLQSAGSCSHPRTSGSHGPAQQGDGQPGHLHTIHHVQLHLEGTHQPSTAQHCTEAHTHCQLEDKVDHNIVVPDTLFV